MERDPMEMALSTDIVVDIVLRHLSVRDLLSCRLASKYWNKAASSVLRKCWTMTKPILDEHQLTDLEDCAQQSWDFPFTGLRLHLPWRLNSARAMEFFKKYGTRFTRLRLDIHEVIRLDVMAPFINYLPRLSSLELGWSYTTDGPEVQSVDSGAGEEDPNILILQSLRTLRICDPCPAVNEDALGDMLTATSPSLQIECLDATPQVLRTIINAGKLRAISSITFHPIENDDYFEFGSASPSLTELDCTASGCLPRGELKKIILSSQHTLKTMYLDATNMGSAFECLWNEFPVFAKLNTLHLCIEIDSNYSCEHLFRGRQGLNFPALKVLILDVSYKRDKKLGTKLSDGLFVVPSVTRITLAGYVCEDGMKQLAQSFPNVIEVTLDYMNYSGARPDDGGINPFEIWSVQQFKCLEKLEIYNVIAQPPTKNCINMDSFLTGIPVGICGNLHKKEQLALSLMSSSFRDGLSEVLRDNPSILELENLRELRVCVRAGDELKELPDSPPFISMISVWYALEMMPKLEAKFVYYDSSPAWRNEERRDNAALETAFKYVKPFVKLERL